MGEGLNDLSFAILVPARAEPHHVRHRTKQASISKLKNLFLNMKTPLSVDLYATEMVPIFLTAC